MGGTKYSNEFPIHRVEFSYDFELCRFTVTQWLWKQVMGNADFQFQGESRPVEVRNWYDCIHFCNALSKRVGLVPFYEIEGRLVECKLSNGFRLPTEAEWEYAARGGSYGRYYEYPGSPSMEQVGWYKENNQNQPFPLGLKRPNELGLYDMGGNHSDWCWDWYNDYSVEPKRDTVGPSRGTQKVYRGGGYDRPLSRSGIAYRSQYYPDGETQSFVAPGFRLARTIG